MVKEVDKKYLCNRSIITNSLFYIFLALYIYFVIKENIAETNSGIAFLFFLGIVVAFAFSFFEMRIVDVNGELLWKIIRIFLVLVKLLSFFVCIFLAFYFENYLATFIALAVFSISYYIMIGIAKAKTIEQKYYIDYNLTKLKKENLPSPLIGVITSVVILIVGIVWEILLIIAFNEVENEIKVSGFIMPTIFIVWGILLIIFYASKIFNDKKKNTHNKNES